MPSKLAGAGDMGGLFWLLCERETRLEADRRPNISSFSCIISLARSSSGNGGTCCRLAVISLSDAARSRNAVCLGSMKFVARSEELGYCANRYRTT